MPKVSVIMLAYAATSDLYRMTQRAIRLVYQAEKKIEFDFIVVETSDQIYKDVKMVYPKKAFGYNEYLREGFKHCAEDSDFILILNNDIEPRQGFISTMIAAMGDTYGSASARCGWLVEHKHIPTTVVESYRVFYEVCGWNILFKREILNIVPFNDLFPVELVGYYQDDFYAWQLQRHAIRHILVRDAVVCHYINRTLKQVPYGKDMMWPQKAVFEAMKEKYKNKNIKRR